MEEVELSGKDAARLLNRARAVAAGSAASARGGGESGGEKGGGVVLGPFVREGSEGRG